MRFIEKCEKLIESYKNDCVVRKNGTILLKIDNLPKSRYMFYKGLKKEYIKEYLIDAYKNTMPKEYIELLEMFNGVNLFTIKVHCGKNIMFALSRFLVFGLPLTSPHDRKDDEEEPFDIRVQDLERHQKISGKWLKIGCYMKNLEEDIFHDIFVDTEDGKVYECVRNRWEIEATWNSLDDCLCEVFDYLSTTEWEYFM